MLTTTATMSKICLKHTSDLPKTKLSGLKSCPNGPDLTESMVPGSRSINTARGTYFPPVNLQVKLKLLSNKLISQQNRLYFYKMQWRIQGGGAPPPTD